MATSDWDEIKRLASDFQRVQLSSSIQKLSERNCIEIVQRLLDLKILNVIYTTDGKEYLTPKELSKEILEELAVAGGRINLVDLQQILNVDYGHIEAKVNELLRTDKSLKLILGQLIEKNYFDSLSEEINEKLQEQGLITISELAKNYNFPGDVLKELISERLGTIILGKKDTSGNELYTDSYIARHKALLMGMFRAITRPAQVFPIITKYGFQETLIYSILDKLIEEGHIPGSISGGRPHNVTYMPNIYIKSQQQWVDSFYNQNSYIEYDCLTRLGIPDAQGYIKKRFPNEGLEYLKTCCLGQTYKERVMVEMEEALETGAWFNLMPHLPSICTLEDAQILSNTLTKKKNNIIVLSECYLINDFLVDKAMEHFKPLICDKAEQTVRENPSILLGADRQPTGKMWHNEDAPAKDQKKKKIIVPSKSGGGGAGSQGREVKIKATKKKYLVGHSDDVHGDEANDNINDNENKINSNVFMTISEITNELTRMLVFKDAPEDLVEHVAIRLARLLNSKYEEELKSVFLQTLQTKEQVDFESSSSSTTSTKTTTSPSTSNNPVVSKKKMFADVSEKLSTLYSNVKMFEKGISYFKDDVQTMLTVHLLKTLCTDMTNLIFSLYLTDTTVNTSAEITNEDRNKIMALIKDSATKSVLSKLNSSISPKKQVLDNFFQHFENICSPSFLDIVMKRDKKKERQQQFNHKQSLLKDLQFTDDPALVLHICSVLLFQSVTQSMLHCPGKCVPHVVNFLKDHLPFEHYQVLMQCQDLIIRLTRISDENDQTEKNELTEAVKPLVIRVKELPVLIKNANITNVNDSDI